MLDLFSGIGGFSLGLERAGMTTAAFCEFNAPCRNVLQKHWPDVPIFNDVRTLNKEALDNAGIKDIGLICGGYPCQPFSVAGQQKGEDDDRHLWPEVLRLIKELRPTWVVCENVAGHIHMGLDQVLADLDRANYNAQVLLIPACAVNAQHRRDRIWIIAHADSERLETDKTMARTQPKPHDERSIEPGPIHPDASRAMLQGRAEESLSRITHLQGELFRSGEVLGIRADESEPGILGTTHGIPGRVDRLKQLGNSVVPQIVEAIGRCIVLTCED